MQLSAYSDFSIRVLMYAGLKAPERVTVYEVASAFGISRNHLVKIVHQLGRAGYLVTTRGVGGGFTLGRPPAEIVLGEVMRRSEGGQAVIDCTRGNIECRLYPGCRLKEALDEAANAFFAVLDRYSLADLLSKESDMRQALNLGAPRAPHCALLASPRKRRCG